jgi:predicted nucleotide-binding protein
MKQAAQLTPQQMVAGIERLKRRLLEVQSFDPQSVTDQHNAPALDVLEAAVDDALVRTFGGETLDYERYKYAKDFDRGPFNYMHQVPPNKFQASISRSKDSSVALLGQAIRSLEEQLEEHASRSPATQEAAAPATSSSRKVFVVHGHDEGAREAMARFLERIELEAIILHEQADQGFTIIEKFDTYAKQVGFAVVLLTPDDLGGPALADAPVARARQNVIFELGYFVGKLGRGRACLLRKGAVEIPSDLYGVIYTDMDAANGWKLKLVKELKAAEVPFNEAKVLGA